MESMGANSDDPARRYFHAARWYLPPMADEPEPDPTLACTYALLAVYAKLDTLIDAISAATGQEKSNPDASRDLRTILRTLGWQPPTGIREGLGHN
jgi:hypothetical protein